jgi:signal transduction histidine kinase
MFSGESSQRRYRLPEETDDSLRRLINSALRGVERAAILTHRLLAFSRQQPLEPKTVSVNALIAGMSELLHRTLGESIAIETVLAGGLWPVFVDANQLESSLLNLPSMHATPCPIAGN